MTPRETLMELYNIRKEIENKNMRSFQLGVGLPYDIPALEEIDKQIEIVEKQVFPNGNPLVAKQNSNNQNTPPEKLQIRINPPIMQNNLIALADRFYQSFIDENSEWNFFLGLADYVQFVIDNPQTTKIAQSLTAQRGKLQNALDEIEIEAIKELEQVKRELLKILKDNQIKNAGIDNLIKEYDSWKNETTHGTSTKAQGMGEALEDIFRLLSKNGHQELIKKFATFFPDNPEAVKDYHYSEKLKSFNTEQDNFNEIKSRELWWSWSELTMAYLTIFSIRGEPHKLSEDAGKNFWKLLNIKMLCAEMSYIKDVGERPYIKDDREFNQRISYFQKETFVRHAKRFHNYLIQELNKVAIQPQNSLVKNSQGKLGNLEIKVKDREIWVNNYLIGKPHAVGSNFEFFEFVRSQKANTAITRDNLHNLLKDQINKKSFIKILTDLGFKGELRKVFFYKVGKDALHYRGDEVSNKQLDELSINSDLLLAELKLAGLKYNKKSSE